jgi:hypothetical protein
MHEDKKVFETEVKGLGKVQFFVDQERNCCWFTVNQDFGWAAAKPDQMTGVKFIAVNSPPNCF